MNQRGLDVNSRRLFCPSLVNPISPQQFNFVFLDCRIIVLSIPVNDIYFCCCLQFFAHVIRNIVNLNYFSWAIIPAQIIVPLYVSSPPCPSHILLMLNIFIICNSSILIICEWLIFSYYD